MKVVSRSRRIIGYRIPGKGKLTHQVVTGLLIMALLLLSISFAPPPALATRTVQGVVVELKPGVDPKALARAIGGELLRREPGNFASLKVSGDREQAITKLKAFPGVLTAEKSRMLKISGEKASAFTSVGGSSVEAKIAASAGVDQVAAAGMDVQGDPYFGDQWGLIEAQVPQAWDLGADGSGITIAIVDTGVDLNHPDLKDKLVPGYNAILDSTQSYDLQDRNGHGTHVAGIAAAAKGNGYGIAGVAYNAKIMPIKTMDRDGQGQDTDIARGIRWAVDQGANIINLSLGSNGEEAVLKSAVQYALSKNCLVVAAAGNYDSGSNLGVSYPAADPGVIAVSAVDEKGIFANFSVSGPEIALAAPGVRILSDFWQRRLGSTYAWLDGTSMASPFVAGSAALVWSKHRDWSAAQVREVLENGATDLGDSGRDADFGYGLVDPYRSLLISAPLPHLASPALVSLSGGLVQGEAGVDLKVPAQTFAVDTTVTLQTTGSPGDLPAGITPTGSAFQVQWQAVGGSAVVSSASEAPLKMLSLTVQASPPHGGPSGYIFRWTGSRWLVVGGGQATGTIQAGIYEPGTYQVGYRMQEAQPRLAGTDRLGTAIQIAEAAYPTGADIVILARADDFPDALAGVPLAYKLHAPILLTYPDRLDDRVWEEIKKLGSQKIVLLGGTGAIAPSVESRLRALAPTERLAGANRYATAGAVAKALGTRGEAMLANGENFPDALAAAAAAALAGEPILITSVSTLPSETDQVLRQLAVSTLTVVGGEGVVPSAILTNLPGITRLAGADRYATAAAVLKAFPPHGSRVFIATGEDFPDALAGGVLAAVETSGILLVPPAGVPSLQQALVQSWKAITPIALGGSGVVSDAVLSQIRPAMH